MPYSKLPAHSLTYRLLGVFAIDSHARIESQQVGFDCKTCAKVYIAVSAETLTLKSQLHNHYESTLPAHPSTRSGNISNSSLLVDTALASQLATRSGCVATL